MNINKMMPEMLDAMMAELDAAIAPVGQKYGFKLSCGWGEIINGGLDGTFTVTAEAVFPADYTPEKIAFAKFLAENRYDMRFSLSADCFGKKFTYAGREFQIVGAHGYFNDKLITVRADGDLYLYPGWTERRNCIFHVGTGMESNEEVRRKIPCPSDCGCLFFDVYFYQKLGVGSQKPSPVPIYGEGF